MGCNAKNNCGEVKKISNIDMYLFIETYIAKRYGKANNKYTEDYDPKKPLTFIVYVDMNNLYVSGNGWVSSLWWGWVFKNVGEFDVMPISEKNETGYILEVELEYPDNLHKLRNDYPLAPEKLAVSSDMLSKYCKKIAGKYKIKVDDVKKLVRNLGNKTKYVLHYRNLQLYLSLGMKLTKIYRVLKFKQSDWMKKYIDFNTEKRKNAANDLKKIFLN